MTTTLPIDRLNPMLAQASHDCRAVLAPRYNEQVTGITISESLMVVAYKATMGTCANRGMRVVTCERSVLTGSWTVQGSMHVHSPEFVLARNGMYAEGICK